MEPVLLMALLLIGVFAGAFGAVFGLGGGIILIPVMTILFGLGATEAAAASLIGIVATSAGAASRGLRKGTANIRLGLLLEITTSIGAIIGAAVAVYLADWALFLFFAAIMLYSGVKMALAPERKEIPEDAPEGMMTFEYRDAADGDRTKRYEVQNVKSGLGLCVAAGMISSMTGVGGGSVKVPLMNIHMHVPVKVASATSSYMIGITAFSGAVIYLAAGQVLLDVAAAVSIGTYTGALIGAKIAERVQTATFKRYLSAVFFFVCFTMILKAGGYL